MTNNRLVWTIKNLQRPLRFRTMILHSFVDVTAGSARDSIVQGSVSGVRACVRAFDVYHLRSRPVTPHMYVFIHTCAQKSFGLESADVAPPLIEHCNRGIRGGRASCVCAKTPLDWYSNFTINYCAAVVNESSALNEFKCVLTSY